MDLSYGLTTKAAEERIKNYGRNEIVAKKAGVLVNFLHWLISPITLMLLMAAALSFYSGRKFDFYFILILAILNFVISALQEHKADQAIAILQNKLVIKTKVKRDGKWQLINAPLLVPGDIVMVSVGDIVPADMTVVDSKNLSVNEAALTGESMPKNKNKEDKLLAGSYIATGSAACKITLTGRHTEYGKTLVSIEKSNKRSLLEKEILTITYLLAILSLLAAVFLSIYLAAKHLELSEILRLDLSLLIAGVPVSMPTVMTIIIGLGVLELAGKQVIVRRLAALENLSNVNLLLSDKTGTLTKNQISISKIIPFGNFSEKSIVSFARMTVNDDLAKDPISQAIITRANELNSPIDYKVIEQIPADSNRKRATAKIQTQKEKYLISCGAPQIIAKICKLNSSELSALNNKVARAAEEGFRTLAVAVRKNYEEEKDLGLIGLLYLSDIPVSDSAEIISHLKKQGIEVKMLTGDNLSISKRIAKRIGLPGKIFNRNCLKDINFNKINKSWWEEKAGFAEILPEDKHNLAEAAKKNYVIAVTGDGVNDLPATATADVGIAVKNSVDALKSSADIVILSEGLSAIKDALLEARKIFERLYSYSVYRISESFRLIITIACLGFFVHTYPISPIQLILLAFLNDLPIISLAYNRVKISGKPSKSRSKRRLYRGLLHGTVGVMSSLSLYFILANVFHMPLYQIQTAYFLKLTVSGHMLIYVAHTDRRWFKFLPSRAVILATTITQAFASLIAGIGLFMPSISLGLIGFVWLWSLGWMQVSDIAKALIPKK